MNSATLVIPERTIDQRMESLRRANEIRTRRKYLKRDLRSGHVTPAAVLCTTDCEWLHTMRVIEVLLATPKLGRVKINRALNACRISPSKTIYGMTQRQREELLDYLTVNHQQAEIGVAA